MKITTSSILASIVGFTALLSVAGPSLALPLFHAEAHTGPLAIINQEFTSNSPVIALVDTGTLIIPSGIASATGAAEASAGQLSARGSGALSVLTPGLGGTQHGGTGEARFTLDDIVISGPEGTVSTFLNLTVNGGMSGTVNTVTGPGYFLGAVGRSTSVQLSGGFFALAHTPFAGSVIASGQVGNCGPTGCTETNSFVASGLFDGFTGDDMNLNLSLPVFVAQVGAPFTLDMRLIAGGSASYIIQGTTAGDFSLSADGSSDFSHTVSFPTAGPVFNLPAGYTVNSVSGLIVNNQWTGGGVTSVPEPVSLALLGIGLAGLAASRRRKKT